MSSSPSSRIAFILALASTLPVAGCFASPVDDTTESGESELRSLLPSEIVGSIAFGETKTIAYEASPTYRALSFEAKAGDEISARFDGAGLDTIGYLLSSTFATLKRNDNESTESRASAFVHRISKDGTYYLVVREANKQSGDVTISLSRRDGSVPSACTPGNLFVDYDTITGDTTWDKCTVTVLKTPTVPKGARLTILPGVVVSARQADGSIKVEGTLRAVGTRTAPIVFTTLAGTPFWQGLEFSAPDATTTDTLSYVVIEKVVNAIRTEARTLEISDTVLRAQPAMQNNAGIGASNATIKVSRSLITGFNESAIHTVKASKLEIEDSVVRQNNYGITCEGDDTDQPTVRIDHSDVVDSTGATLNASTTRWLHVSKSNLVNTAMRSVRVSMLTSTEASFIRDSNLYGADGAGAYTWYQREGIGTASLDISSNYWATDRVETILDYTRTGGTGRILFTGFTSTLVSDAGPRNVASLMPEVKAALVVHPE